MRPFSTLKLSLAGLAAVATLGLLAFQGQPASGSALRGPDSKYIGANKCKSCHSAEESGNQYDKWKASTHSKAFEVLGSAEAKEIAKGKDIADPQASDDCLKCHVTAKHGVPAEQLKGKWDDKMTALGVQCESCHGGGDDHMKARFKAASSGEKPDYKGLPVEEIMSAVPAAKCKECHNEESPTYKEFCYHKATHAIAHANPLKDHGEPKMGCDDACHCKGECTHTCGG